MRLQDSQPRPGARKRRKRIGCGESSGHGKTSCKGHKGQMARAGRGIRPGFEGGQMPLCRRVPKKGFSNERLRDVFETVNVGQLNDLWFRSRERDASGGSQLALKQDLFEWMR